MQLRTPHIRAEKVRLFAFKIFQIGAKEIGEAEIAASDDRLFEVETCQQRRLKINARETETGKINVLQIRALPTRLTLYEALVATD